MSTLDEDLFLDDTDPELDDDPDCTDEDYAGYKASLLRYAVWNVVALIAVIIVGLVVSRPFYFATIVPVGALIGLAWAKWIRPNWDTLKTLRVVTIISVAVAMICVLASVIGGSGSIGPDNAADRRPTVPRTSSPYASVNPDLLDIDADAQYQPGGEELVSATPTTAPAPTTPPPTIATTAPPATSQQPRLTSEPQPAFVPEAPAPASRERQAQPREDSVQNLPPAPPPVRGEKPPPADSGPAFVPEDNVDPQSSDTDDDRFSPFDNE